jgi:anti-anti-sigma regulatory factor
MKQVVPVPRELAPDNRVAFFREIRRLAVPGVTQLVLDFQRTDRADTAALRELGRLQAQLSRNGFALAVQNLSDALQAEFQRLDLFRRLPLAD